MALRIGGAKKEMPVEEPMAEEQVPVEEPMPEEDLMAELPETLEEEQAPEEPPMPEAGGQVDPLTAGYLGPEEGPFVCGNCVFYGDQTCSLVAGPIDPEGCCNLFTSANTEAPMEEEEMPMEEPLPEEMPAEVMEPEAEEASEEGY